MSPYILSCRADPIKGWTEHYGCLRRQRWIALAAVNPLAKAWIPKRSDGAIRLISLEVGGAG